MLTVPTASAQQGDLDRSFGKRGYVSVVLTDKKQTGTLIETAIQPDGKIVALVAVQRYTTAGYVREAGRTQLIRLTRSGRPDRSFGKEGRVIDLFGKQGNEIPASLDIGPSGSIAVAGVIAGAGPTARQPAVALFTSRGERDRSFGSDGIARLDFVTQNKLTTVSTVSRIRFVKNGAVLVGVGARDGGLYSGGAVRLDRFGQMDGTFGTAGISMVAPTPTFPVQRSTTSDLLAFADGSYVLVGSSTIRIKPIEAKDTGDRNTCLIAKFDAGGNPQNSFGISGQTNVYFEDTYYGVPTGLNCSQGVQRTDGSYVTLGDIWSAAPKSVPYDVAFLISGDGALDPRWPIGPRLAFPEIPWSTGVYEGDVSTAGMVAGPSTSIYVGFAYQALDGRDRVGVIRLNPQGRRSESFGTNGVSVIGNSFGRFDPSTLDRQSKGRVVLGGVTQAARGKRKLALRFARIIAN